MSYRLPTVNETDRQNVLFSSGENISIDALMDDRHTTRLLEAVSILEDEEGNFDYSAISNLGMVYLYVHDNRRTRKPGTKRAYFRELAAFLEYVHSIGKDDIRGLSRADMQKYQIILDSSYPKTLTRARKVVIISSFLNWCFTEGYLSKNIARGLQPVKLIKDDIPERDIAEHQLKETIAYYKNNPKVQSLLLLLGSTGLRLNEIITPKWSDLYYDQLNQKYYLRTRTKRDKLRHARIREDVLLVLMEYRLRLGLSAEIKREEHSPFYPNRFRKHYSLSTLSTYLSSCMEASGLTTILGHRVTPHFLRHYFAQQAHANGAPLEWISETLDHATTTITKQNYLSRQIKKEHDVSDYVNLI